MPTQADLFTVGYQGKTVPEMLAKLKAAGVELVVDVRALPLSRKRGFSKTGLSNSLAAAGIEYLHAKAAGNPFRDQKEDVERCLSLYRKHLAGRSDVVEELVHVASGHRAALLCVEAEAHMCHRSVIADAIKAHSPIVRIHDL